MGERGQIFFRVEVQLINVAVEGKRDNKNHHQANTTVITYRQNPLIYAKLVGENLKRNRICIDSKCLTKDTFQHKGKDTHNGETQKTPP